jgi:hypothetical protein
MPRTAAKVDANQQEIVEGLRRCGWSVQVTSGVGKGFPDLVVGALGRNGRVNIFLEVKDGNKPPSARQLTKDQVEWHSRWRGQVAVVNSTEEAITTVLEIINN